MIFKDIVLIKAASMIIEYDYVCSRKQTTEEIEPWLNKSTPIELEKWTKLHDCLIFLSSFSTLNECISLMVFTYTYN